ncbi:trans-aconitate methyltransferase [Methanohalophilus levihalophilus]|nr:trans-aconitate methyltransferase [Methanohalophilus levihalophilus]
MVYEFDGKKYEQASTHQKEWGSRLIAELNLKGNERVLDLGCGDGTLSVRISDFLPNGEVIGIDASRSMIDVAIPKERDNLHFLLMDINALNFVEEFDVVFSNAALHWVKDHHSLLRNVSHSLYDGGQIRFNFAAEGNCSSFFKVIREAMALGSYAEHFSTFEWPWYMPSVDEYSALAKSSGLCNVKVWGENADRFFPDSEAMIKWIDQPSLVPFISFLPKEKQMEFREFVINRMIEETRQEDKRCFETFRRINILAQK